MRAIAIALGAGLLAAAPIEAQTYIFHGLCSDCEGTVTGMLTLHDYTPGDAFTAANLVSFSYGSNLVNPFTVTSAQSLSGAFGASGEQLADIDIHTNNFTNGQAYGNYEFVSHTDGSWTVSFQAGDGGQTGTGLFDFGTQGTWSVAAAVPESANWALMLLGFGGVGAALRRMPRRSARATFAI